MRQVGVALAVCLVASTLAAGQNAPGSTQSKKSNSEAVASDFDPVSGKYVG
jgi:hypothetical protein